MIHMQLGVPFLQDVLLVTIHEYILVTQVNIGAFCLMVLSD